MKLPLYPYRFKPVYKDYIWGGDKIIRKYDRDEPPGVYAESWEVSDRPEGMNVVTNGPLAGKTLHDLVTEMGADLLGPKNTNKVFPLLVKLIDSKQCLSVQVHPDDRSAAKYGGEAKTEMWYVLDAEPGAQVYAGLKEGVDEDAFKQAMELKMFEEILVPVPVSPHDAIFIPGGRVHAIDAGCLLLEVQQNSNTTYRIYDWGRVGDDGQSRPLHIEQALQVIDWNDAESPKVTTRRLDTTGPNEVWDILRTPYFKLERLVLHEPWLMPTHHASYHVLFVAKGKVAIKSSDVTENLSAGSACLVPAALGSYEASPLERPSTILRVSAA